MDAGKRVLAIQRRPSPLAGRAGYSERQQDLTDAQGTRRAIAELIAPVPRLDVAILNAGVLGDIRDLRETQLEEIQRVMDINTWANKTLLDTLLSSDVELSQVIGLSSGAAVSGSRGWSSYALSKAAFHMLLKLYAAEVPDTHFCSLAPGLVDTAMQDVLCAMDEAATARYPSLQRIQSRRGTEDMPSPDAIAEKLWAYVERVRSEPSGSYVDIRQLSL